MTDKAGSPDTQSDARPPSLRFRLLASGGILLILLGLYLRVTRSEPRAVSPQAEEGFAAARQAMVDEGIVGWGITDEAVIAVMRSVPRHEFVLEEFLGQAYENHPLPIGYGQTISQPYIVALMSQELEVSPGDRVLEVGTGSGYQAAVLAQLGIEVYTVEIIPELGEPARERLARLGYKVDVLVADGYNGWEEYAPYAAIIVTAAPDHVPRPLLEQLADGGLLVIPIGPPGGYQELWKIRRTGDDFQSTSLGGVQFVPLVHEEPAGYIPEDW
ncbi:MAG TPA: protein-L-isoaspartate(D-aspartate) O-methyltransferase [Anaerolineales bacterium]|nr:protein-L-isoaspartate(D-aspartate) O-methyltransferase [Anaerolineales bacterium]